MKTIGLLIVLLPVPLLGFSQTAPAPQARVPLPSAQVITLGNSVATLGHGWKFSPGDSPLMNGSPVWSQPGYDDSHWALMDLTPKPGSFDIQYGTAGFVPGWTRRGYPKLNGYAWYRLRLRIINPGEPLWLKMPLDFDDAYQLYANGRYVGQFGKFSANGVALYYSRAASYPLPPPDPDGNIVLAVRFYMSTATQFLGPDVGGMHAPPVLGLASTVHLLQTAEDAANVESFFGPIFQSFLFLLVSPLALWAWLRTQHERAWLWLFLVLACNLLNGVLTVLGDLSTVLTISQDTFANQVVATPLRLFLWVMFWREWFGLREKRWISRTASLLLVAQMLTEFLANSGLFGLRFVPQPWLPSLNLASVWSSAALGALLVVILVEGFRRDRTEALLAAFPILLLEYASFGAYLQNSFDIQYSFFPFGLGVSTGNIASMLMLLAVGAVAMRRFLRTQVSEELARQAIAKDLEQAQQLQQRVLVPEAIASRHFMVETEYRPAQTVGGDFFQTLSRPDGSLLVVIGDVSGKGVSAAMLVAVLVGAIRTRADESFDPASMLATLNGRLIGRSGGHFATCLAAEIHPDGTMRIANAGHLPPYLNGREMEVEGSLPLGVTEKAEYPVQTFRVKPGDRLTFMTDGVVEATNEAKELFGFERTREISIQSAVAIVDEAQRFGQEDDITVLAVAFAV